MSPDVTIDVRFHAPPAALQPYFTTFYITDIATPAGQLVRDALQPEWANLRFFAGDRPRSWIDGSQPIEGARFVATGPSTKSANFELGTSRFWGIGLLPLGWARFVGESARDHANLIADGADHPTFQQFVTLGDQLSASVSDEAAELERIIAYFEAFPELDGDEEARILAIHAAMVDPQIETVTQLVERVGASQRTIERVCIRHFGFPPKLLLRRQRFMRSLAQYMLDRSRKWIGAIDGQYHDQAQFVRDFRDFMGMTPRQYAAMPHPVLEKFMHERARVHGAAAQTLDRPGGNGTPTT